MISVMRKKATRVGVVAAALIVGAAVGGVTIAGSGEDGDDGASVPAGEVILGTGADASEQTFSTAGTTFDPTILTKFIPARSFVANQGSGVNDDLVTAAGNCVTTDTNAGGTVVSLYAGVELPDGARIKRVTFYGDDANVASNISVTLRRSTVSSSILLGGSPSRSDDTVDSFATTGSGGTTIVSGADNLEERTGSFNSSPIILSAVHRFHTVNVVLTKAAGVQHVLCGIEVQYQVSATTEVSYHPISPVRAIDTRIAAYGASAGIFAPGTNRVISVADGHDLATGAVTLANAVPAGATAITYNLTSADPVGGSNFLAITAGDATSFAASALNYNGTSIANGGTAPIAADRTVKIWNGAPPASTHVIIDITGYYTASVYPNTGN